MSTATTHEHALNPGLIFETFQMYQRSAALKAAIDLELFTHIGKGHQTAEEIAKAVASPVRGVRILCDFLVIMGFLGKRDGRYSLSLEAAVFLDKSSRAYLGSAAGFILDPRMMAPFADLATVVRNGRTTLPDEGTVSHDNPVWVEFARDMAAMQMGASMEIAGMMAGDQPMEVLDIAAGHGLFGIMFAAQNPQARITALDWANVLAVATENAQKFGVADRHKAMPGDAFEEEFGGPYDVILVTNFFHHFDIPTCETLVKKIFAALKPGGRCLTLDFVPNEDRVSPPASASFAMMMLGSTASGDAYTFSEYQKMFAGAGFSSSQMHALEKSPGSLIVSKKA